MNLNDNEISPRQTVDRETAARQAEITTQYDPVFYRLYLVCSLILIVFGITILVIRFTAKCSMPLIYWLILNTITSFVYMGLNVFDYYHYSYRHITLRIIHSFKIGFVIIWLFGQFYVFSTSPQKCDAILWGSCMALILLEYVRIAFPVILILTICWWYPLLERFIENSPNRGASMEAISKLPVRNCKKESICSICFARTKETDEARSIPCNHEFHRKCLDEWLGVKSTCPLCRSQVFKDIDAEMV